MLIPKYSRSENIPTELCCRLQKKKLNRNGQYQKRNNPDKRLFRIHFLSLYSRVLFPFFQTKPFQILKGNALTNSQMITVFRSKNQFIVVRKETKQHDPLVGRPRFF